MKQNFVATLRESVNKFFYLQNAFFNVRLAVVSEVNGKVGKFFEKNRGKGGAASSTVYDVREFVLFKKIIIC